MNVNERLAAALGFDVDARAEHEWQSLIGDHNIEWCDRCCDAVDTCCGGRVSDAGECEPVFPDYEHSMDALVRDVVPVLRERGFTHIEFTFHEWLVEKYTGIRRENVVEATVWREGFALQENPNVPCYVAIGDTPAAALSEAAAIALEATE